MAGGIEVPEAAVEAAAGAAASQRVVFVLEGASLEVAKVGKSYELLNADDHAGFLRRHNKDPALYRPDICHQVRRRRSERWRAAPPRAVPTAAVRAGAFIAANF